MSDEGILVIVPSFEPIWLPAAGFGATIEHAKNILFEIENLLGIIIDECVLVSGGIA